MKLVPICSRGKLPTRREVMHAALGSAVGVAFALPAWRSSTAQEGAAADTVTVARLGDGLHVLTAGRVNAVALTADDGVVLVDGGAAASSGALLRAVEGLPAAGPVHTLFNTHWHPDQTGSNERLGRAGATIVAHENTRLWLTTDITWPWDGSHFEPLPDVALPNETFYREGELGVGGNRVQYGYIRHAPHTDGDLYVYFADANVLAVGDAVSGDGWPLIDWWTGGWIGGMVGGLELLLSMTNSETRIVPARGPVMSRSDLQAHYDMYSIVFERLSRMLHSGRGPEDAVLARPTEEFDAVMGPSEAFVRRSFESLWGYLSPDA